MSASRPLPSRLLLLPLLHVLLFTGPSCLAAPAYKLIKSFGDPSRMGYAPSGKLTASSDGFLYGTTRDPNSRLSSPYYTVNDGTIYRIKPDGSQYEVLHRFVLADGLAKPQGHLLEATDGFLYGTTTEGSVSGRGAVYRFDPATRAITILKQLENGVPRAGLIEGTDGVLYGTARGQPSIVFRLNRDGTDYRIIQELPKGRDLESFCEAPLLLGSDGLLYGTCARGGQNDNGSVFRLTTEGADFQILRHFSNTPGAPAFPAGGLIEGGDGRIYGMLGSAVNNGAGAGGAVFSMERSGADFRLARTFSIATGLWGLVGELLETPDGRLHGVVERGSGTTTYGGYFSMDRSGSNFITLRNDSLDVAPMTGLVQSGDGWLHGSAVHGPMSATSSLFRIPPDANAFVETLRFSMTGDESNVPIAFLEGPDGWLYYLARQAIFDSPLVLYKIRKDGSDLTRLTEWKVFDDENNPVVLSVSVVAGHDGYFYTTAADRSANPREGIVRVSPEGEVAGWVIAFPPGEGRPSSLQGIHVSMDGYIYGASEKGGIDDIGTFYRVALDGSGFTVLRHCTVETASQGAGPRVPPAETGDGKLCGIISAGLYTMNKDGSDYTYTLFPGVMGNIAGQPLDGGDGFLYGCGLPSSFNDPSRIYRYDRERGEFTTLHAFERIDGGIRYNLGYLLALKDGYIYGITDGFLFRIGITGEGIEILHDITGMNRDGRRPANGIFLGSDGALYGSYNDGGEYGLGGLFRYGEPSWPVPGEADTSFQHALDTIPDAVTLLPDGRMVVGGNFWIVEGRSRRGLVRLNSAGRLDASYNPDVRYLSTTDISGMTPMEDGRLLIFGRISSIGGTAREYIGLLNPNGSLVPAFNPAFDDAVIAAPVLPGGQILAGGSFHDLNGRRVSQLARLNPDGSADTSFLRRANESVLAIAVQSDGKAVLGGMFTSIGGVSRTYLARLNANGTLDGTFVPQLNGHVLCLAVQADGKILAGGSFDEAGGSPRRRIARFNADGSLDEGFYPVLTGGGSSLSSIIVQADGKIIFSGSGFAAVNGVERTQIARVNANGVLDESFNPSLTSPTLISGTTDVYTTLQADGKVLAHGGFTVVNGVERKWLARLHNDPATQQLEAVSRRRVIWLRGGSSPETHEVSFAVSIDSGSTWLPLGAASRIPGGWELSGLDLPASGLLRARARVFGARFNNSSSLLETIAPSEFEVSLPRLLVHRGTAATDPLLSSGATVDLGELSNIEDSVSTTLTLRNDGGETLTLANFSLSDPASEFTVVPPENTTLDPGEAAAVQVAFRIHRTGLNAAVLRWETNDPGSTSFEVNLRATVLAPVFVIHDGAEEGAAEIVVPEGASEVDEIDLGTARRGDSLGRDFRVANPGTKELVVSAPATIGAHRIVSALPLSVPSGGSAVIRVERNTSVLGRLQEQVGLPTNDHLQRVPSLRFVSTVVDPEINVQYLAETDPVSLTDGQNTSVGFGEARQTRPIVLNFSIANEGTAPLLVSGFTLPDGYSVLEGPALPLTLEAGTSLALRLQLTAAALGEFSGTVVIASDDFDEPAFRFPVNGLVTAPEIAVHDGATAAAPELVAGQLVAVDFGEARQTAPVTRAFVIANEGTAPLRVSGLAAPEGFSWVAPPAVPFDIAPGAISLLSVRLDAALLGAFAGEITIESDDLDEPAFRFPVTGLVIAPEIAVHAGATAAAPELVAGQAVAVDFGQHVQGTPGVRAFTIANTGTAPLAVASITVPPGYELSASLMLPALIAVGDSVAWEVRLVSLDAGRHAGSVVITSDDLDEAVFVFPVSGEVFIPAPVAALPNPGEGTNTTLNRQTGLREQTVRLVNDTTAIVPGYRLLVRGLPAGVTLANASEVRADGTMVVLVRLPLAPFSSFDLLLEYASADRRRVTIAPEITVEVVLEPPDDTATDGAGAFAIERVLRLPGEDSLLLEFGSEKGRLYVVQYSEDGVIWRSSPTQVRGAGNRTQWIDRGPPRTASAPALQNIRFYRILLLAE